MTTDEQAAMVRALRGAFAGDLGPERATEILRYCGAWRPDDARAAIDQLVAHGVQWMPTPGELVRALERARGGRGTFTASAALRGMTLAEYDAFCRGEAERRIGAGVRGLLGGRSA